MRPQPWYPRPVPTMWVDFTTGRGVLDNGQPVRPKIGERRKNPNLADLLDTAQALRIERIMFTGKLPEPAPGGRHWLITKTPGWTPGAHWLAKPSTGRFVHDLSGHRVEVRTAAEWFGDGLDPQTALAAWTFVDKHLSDAVPRAHMWLTPGATGTNAWALSLPQSIDPGKVSPDIAEEIHATSGQHRVEHLVAGPSRCRTGCPDCLPLVDADQRPRISFSYVDGRFMYAGLMRELGIGPGRRLTRAEAADLLDSNAYARARYRVRVTVPEGWQHVGILPKAHDEASDGWHYPNRPGARWTCWADAVEVDLARRNGWSVEPEEAVVFETAKVLDTFAARLVRARERSQAAADVDPAVRKAAGAAFRAMLIQAVGSFASRGREQTRIVWSPREVPADRVATLRQFGDAYAYTDPSPRSNRLEAYYRPELAAQIWARGRARVLSSTTARGTAHRGGALAMRPDELIGINGDAIYTTRTPQWALPVASGGGDDGAVGRLRLQGVLPDVPTPRTLLDRDKLRAQAEAAGVPVETTQDDAP